MPEFRTIEIVRHNLLGANSESDNGVIINTIHYDENGHETERFNYNTEGELEEHIIYLISDGHVVEEKLEIEGELSERTTRTFDEKGRVLTETHHYLEGGSDVTSYEYEDDKLILKHVIDSDGDEGEKEVWEYEGGKLMREALFNVFGNLEREKIFEYEDDGTLSSTTESHYKDDQPEKTVTFYDANGRVTTEKKYDPKGRLVARTIINYNDEGKPLSYEEETLRGKKITNLEYDESGNNTVQVETDPNGGRISYIERTFNETGHPLTAEIIMEPTLYNAGHHYRLEYKYS